MLSRIIRVKDGDNVRLGGLLENPISFKRALQSRKFTHFFLSPPPLQRNPILLIHGSVYYWMF